LNELRIVDPPTKRFEDNVSDEEDDVDQTKSEESNLELAETARVTIGIFLLAYETFYL